MLGGDLCFPKQECSCIVSHLNSSKIDHGYSEERFGTFPGDAQHMYWLVSFLNFSHRGLNIFEHFASLAWVFVHPDWLATSLGMEVEEGNRCSGPLTWLDVLWYMLLCSAQCSSCHTEQQEQKRGMKNGVPVKVWVQAFHICSVQGILFGVGFLKQESRLSCATCFQTLCRVDRTSKSNSILQAIKSLSYTLQSLNQFDNIWLAKYCQEHGKIAHIKAGVIHDSLQYIWPIDTILLCYE